MRGITEIEGRVTYLKGYLQGLINLAQGNDEDSATGVMIPRVSSLVQPDVARLAPLI